LPLFRDAAAALLLLNVQSEPEPGKDEDDFITRRLLQKCRILSIIQYLQDMPRNRFWHALLLRRRCSSSRGQGSPAHKKKCSVELQIKREQLTRLPLPRSDTEVI